MGKIKALVTGCEDIVIQQQDTLELRLRGIADSLAKQVYFNTTSQICDDRETIDTMSDLVYVKILNTLLEHRLNTDPKSYGFVERLEDETS